MSVNHGEYSYLYGRPMPNPQYFDSAGNRKLTPEEYMEAICKNGYSKATVESELINAYSGGTGGGKSAMYIQVGGNHYKKQKTQPWQIIDEYGLDFYEGSVLKYLLRHPDKGGVEDLKKARHYLDKMIEDYAKP